MSTFMLDGNSLTCEDLYNIGYNIKNTVDLTEEAWESVSNARQVVDDVLAKKKIVYGINTGFGKFSNVVIPEDKLHQLQDNLIKSHAAGVGVPLSNERTRMLFALRINILAKGYSGISVETLKQVIDAFNKQIIPKIPCKGTVGASGDLAPLAHLALGLIGEGEIWDEEIEDWNDAKVVLEKKELEPLYLLPKEGLALINGTQFITSLLTESIIKTKQLLKTVDIVGALTLEALQGTPHAFKECIHKARPHNGQNVVAKRLRSLLHNDELYQSEIFLSHVNCAKVQDAYTLRCMPQIHGVAHDTLLFVENIVINELNSATDNPMIFSDTNSIISGGNFHGEYPAKMADFLAIAVSELATVSERRIERLMNPCLSELPAFLVQEGGINSGFMIAHCTAAALTSENKVLVHPASCDSISTSAAKEDHVSMGGMAARKCLTVIENVEGCIAIELLCAIQGLEFLKPLTTTEPLAAVYDHVREIFPVYDKDRYVKPDIDAAIKLVQSGSIIDVIKPFFEDKEDIIELF